jgi:hypothetical protein
MSTEASLTKRGLALLIGDGYMFTAAAFAVALGLVVGLFALMGSPGSSTFFALTNAVVMFAGGVFGIVVTWLLHDHRITWVAVAGGIAGSAAISVVIPLVAATSFLIGLPLGLFTTWEFAGPVALLVILCAGSVALIAWLLVDATRDLARSRREHVRLDLARIAAGAVLVILAAVTAIETARLGGETGEAVIFAMAAGAAGALAMAGAAVATRLAARQRGTRAPAVGA